MRALAGTALLSLLTVGLLNFFAARSLLEEAVQDHRGGAWGCGLPLPATDGEGEPGVEAVLGQGSNR